MAIDIAKETFQNSCENSLSQTCQRINVKSEVQNCDKVKDNPIGEEENEDDNMEKQPHQRRTYSCYGHCVDNKNNLRYDTKELDKKRKGPNLKQARRLFGGCKKLETSGVVEIIVPDTRSKIGGAYQVGRKRFCKEFLTPFCKSQSLVKVSANVRGMGVKDGYVPKDQSHHSSNLYFETIETPACSGSYFGTRYENIRCKLIGKDLIEIEVMKEMDDFL